MTPREKEILKDTADILDRVRDWIMANHEMPGYSELLLDVNGAIEDIDSCVESGGTNAD